MMKSIRLQKYMACKKEWEQCNRMLGENSEMNEK